MAFIGNVNKGSTYNPGHFLAYNDENVTRETRRILASTLSVTGADGTKHAPMGTAYPSNDGDIEGILYEDVDVTAGVMPGSVVTGNAVVYESRLPQKLTTTAKAKLDNLGFIFTKEAEVTRPDWEV